jgi:hypothetical protein
VESSDTRLGSNVYNAAEPLNLHLDLLCWAMVIVVNEAYQEAPLPALEDAMCISYAENKSRCNGRAKAETGWNAHQISKIGAELLL